MPRELTAKENLQVDNGRKDTKPSVYDPNGTTATLISNNMEAWLILTSKSVKAKALGWINSILESEADKDYQDLLKEATDKEAASLALQQTDLAPQVSNFTDWRSSAGIKGWEDVSEIGWLMQELQAGINPFQQTEEVTHLENLRAAATNRQQISPESVANRKQRLNAWISVLNAY